MVLLVLIAHLTLIRVAGVGLQPACGPRWHERPRQEVSGDHCEGNAGGHRAIEELAQPRHQCQWGEHQERAQTCDQFRHGHLAGASERGLLGRGTQAQVSVRVLQADDGAVHHRPDRQRQPGQRHHVEGVSRGVETDERRQDRDRDGQDGDDRHPPLAQEQQDDQRAQDRSQHALFHQALDRVADVDGLVHHDLQIDARAGQAGLDLVDRTLEGVDNLEGAGTELTKDGNVHLALAVDPHHVGLDEVGVLRGRHVTEERGVARLIAQGDFLHSLDMVEHGVAVDSVIRGSELGAARGQEDVVLVDGLHHVHRREVPRLHLDPVKVHHDRADLTAVDQRRDGSGLRHDLGPHLVPANVEEGRFVLGLAIQGHQADRSHAGRVIRQDDRRQGARRHRGILPSRQRVDLGHGTAAVDIAAEVVADDADTDDRTRLNSPAA